MPGRDPRSYVKTIPLPIASHKGMKLQARSDVVYNPTIPGREEVRKWNYDRRVEQMAEQGFNSCNYKPYKGLGDPFFLDEKKLILHSLGQWDETENLDTSSSSEDEESPEAFTATAPQAALITAKFVLKRTRTNLNTLNKEVVKGRQLIRNVSLGHGLFNLIKQERQAKKSALVAEKIRTLEEARNQWQPPKDSSDEEVSDIEVKNDDEDLENHFGVSFIGNLSDDFDMAFTSTTSSSNYRLSTTSAMTHSSRKHKKQVISRPFTPQYNNLLEMAEHKEDICRSALFRQLCALTWILDAMNLEQGCSMGPISTCWNYLDIRGTKVSAKKAKEERKAEIDWERWLSNQQIGKINKKGSIVKLNRSRSSRLLSHQRASLQSRSISTSSSSSQALSAHQAASLLLPSQGATNQTPMISSREIPLESEAATPIETAEEETLHRTGIFKFLDEYYDSLRREEERKKEALTESDNPQHEQNKQPAAEGKDQEIAKSSRSKKSKTSGDQHQIPDWLSKSPEDKSRSRFALTDLYNRSKSSPELIEFHANKASDKYANIAQDLHNKFKDIFDDKAMTLHDVLEQMERVRLAKCQTKFSSLANRSMDLYRALREMRREEHRMLTRPEIRARQSSIRGNWYTDLLVNLPHEVRDIWYYELIIQKMGKYGLVENTSKQSVYKFLKVLGGLRHWEICSPDISAAIEFCRSKIVEMSMEEYEEWFCQAFPKVLRPKTAPAGLREHVQSEKTESKDPYDGGDDVKKSSSARSKGTIMIASNSAHSKSTSSVASGTDSKIRMVQSAMFRQR